MFWDNFDKLCKQNGKKPNPVAAELGISSGSITAWKNGRIPKWATLKILAAYFGVTINDLLQDETGYDIPHYDPSLNGAVDGKNAYQIYLADVLHDSVSKATHRLSERDVRILNGYIQVAIFGRPIEQVKLENDELLIVEALIEAPVKTRKAPSEDGAMEVTNIIPLAQTPAKADEITFDDFDYAMYDEKRELTDADKEMLLNMAKMLKERKDKGQ